MKENIKRYTKEQRDVLREELARRQLVIKDKKIPVIVMIEGYSGAGKGSAIKSTINMMDPRFFKVYNMDTISEEEWKRPFLYRYAVKMPENGQFSFFDGGYADEIAKDFLGGIIDLNEYEDRLESIVNYERSMYDNGYVIVKIFLEVSKKEQRKRLTKLLSKESTSFRVNEEDLWQNEDYKEFKHIYEDILERTATEKSPWNVLETDVKLDTECDILQIIIDAIDDRIASDEKCGKVYDVPANVYKLAKLPPLKDISLNDKVLSDEEYKVKYKELKKKLSKLHNKLYNAKIPLIVAYEGWDAAGKGGNIKRLASGLDARGYEVFPIASPSPGEKARHFLYRFFTRLPKMGHIAIFDRTWYGRVMVERLEGFCSENDWKRAYNEINEFEYDLYKEGAIIIKFWVQIDKDTQLERFNARKENPEKQWKITDEDYRNREKWDLYEDALVEMLDKTSTEFAPWFILESNDKKYARIKAMETVVEAIEKRLALID